MEEDRNGKKEIHEAFQSIGLGISSVTFERGCYAVQIQPKQTIPWIVKKYMDASKSEDFASGDCCINISSLADSATPNVNMLRQLILAQHLQQLLKTGLSDLVISGCDSSIGDLITRCTTSCPKICSGGDNESLMERLSSSPHVEPAGDGEWTVNFGESVVIQGNPLDQWKLTKNTSIYRQLSSVLSSINAGKMVIYHIVGSTHSYQHQVMLTVLNTLIKGHTKVTHHIIQVGGVKLSPSNSTLGDYIESRRSYLKLSSEEKYGEVVREQGFWSNRIDDLTLTSVKFELLSRSPKQTITMATDMSNSSDIKVGSFVMYNCSRLSTLFKNFQEQVDKGVYPPMYGMEATNFSLLKTEDEWTLVFHYVNAYPVMVTELRASLGQTSVSSPLSQIVKFLHNLSRDFSTYYSRTHVLGENRAHLIPTMMARLWLLKFIHQMLINGLSLLDIQPYDSM